MGVDDHLTHHQQNGIFERVQLSEHTYVLYGRGGNIGFVVTAEGVLVVDSQFQEIAPGALEQVRDVTRTPVRWLVNTHFHGDHTGGNPVFREVAEVFSHEQTRVRLLERAREQGTSVEEIGAPLFTFERELRAYPGGILARIFYQGRGHTDGDAIIYLPGEKVVHLGDLFFNEVWPFIDIDHGGDSENLVRIIDAVIQMLPSDAVVIPGHGRVTDVGGLKRYRTFLTDVRGAVHQALEAGQSLEEFLVSDPLPQYVDYGGGVDGLRRTAGAVYRELSRGS